MKEILAKQIKEAYKSCLSRYKNGWDTEKLKAYKTGVSNALFDIINELEANGLLTANEVEKLDIFMMNTLDTL